VLAVLVDENQKREEFTHHWLDAEPLVSAYVLASISGFHDAEARFDAVSDKRVVLYSGRLSATVPPEGIGFTVETPEAKVIDFGTEFSIDVDGGASEVHVFDGLVRVNHGTSNQRDASKSLDLQASEAVRISGAVAYPVGIAIEANRFIRNFDEPRLNYARVDLPPPLSTGRFSLTAFVYLEAPAENAAIATNWNCEGGNFALSLAENGTLQTTIRSEDGDLSTISGGSVLPQKTWRHVVLTADGEQLQFYEDGKLVMSTPCAAMAASDSDTLWFGTNAGKTQVWDGRIDELALFDRALTETEIATLHRTAQKEISRSQ
jgi:hypothetical protein